MALHRPGTIANEFLALAEGENKKLTSMQIQKLVYITHGWYLAICHDPLVDEIVQAWDYGPVYPSLYHSFKDFGSSPVERDYTTWEDTEENSLGFKKIVPRLTSTHDRELDAIKSIWRIYGRMTGEKLSQLTHMPNTPWSKARAMYPGMRGIPIENSSIRNHYKEKLEKKEASSDK